MNQSLVSLSTGSPPLSFQPTTLPEFMSTPEHYKCAKCQHILLPPVKQTECGHRMCGTCADSLFQEGECVACPGEEEDCLELTPARVMPDRAITRELLRQKVYCANRSHGCNETMKWIELPTHEGTCQWKKIPCTNEGCGKVLFASDLDAHIRHGCEYGTELCDNCDQLIARKQFRNGHAAECALHPRKCYFDRVGCTFEGNKDQLQEHIKESFVRHTKATVDEIKIVKLNQNDLKSKVENMQCTVSDITKTVDSMTKASNNNAHLHSLQLSVAKLSDDLNVLKSRTDHCATSAAVQTCNEDIRNVKEVSAMLESRLAHVENGNNRNQGGGDIADKVGRIERTVGMHDIRIAESDLRFRLLETAAFDGRLIWRIPFYSRRKQDAVDGRTLSLYSQPFYTSYYGYKMCARVYPNGDGLGKGSHVSLFFVMMKGEYDPLLVWPFRQKVTLSILDQSGNRKHITDTFRPDPTSTSFRQPVGEMNIASGSPLFAPQSKVESEPYLKDNTIFIGVSIDKTDLSQPWPW